MIDKRKMTKFKDRDRGRLWPRLIILLAIAISAGESYLTDTDFLCTFEKPICRWRWNSTITDGFKIMSGIQASLKRNETGLYSGPLTDSNNLSSGHFLNLLNTSGMREVHLWSSRLSHTLRRCKIAVWLHMVNMTDGVFRVVADSAIPWVVAEMSGNNHSKWERYEFTIGRIQQDFKILLAIAGNGTHPSHAAVDQIELVGCFPEVKKPGVCKPDDFRCSPDPNDEDFCLNKTQLCDIRIDCISAIDEKLSCDEVPEVGRCDFETGWCSWQNSPDTSVNWTRITGIVDYMRHTGPGYDRTNLNITGMFLYANMSDPDLVLGDMALLDSSNINPPPRYHSRPKSPYYMTCNVRFFYHQFGRSSGSFALYLIEHRPQGDKTIRLFYTYGDKGDTWVRSSVNIPPNLQYTYHLQFEVRRGMRGGGDVAVDDFSMSPECFGVNVPESEKEGYNYDTFKGFPAPTVSTETHSSFVNSSVYHFTTCGSTGRTGPTPYNCSKAYNNTNIDVAVVYDPPILGIQKWEVPETNFYTIIAKGAAGGPGPEGRSSSKGAAALGIIKLHKGQELYMLVGQEGNGGCRRNFAMIRRQPCQRIIPPRPTPPGPRYSPPRPDPPRNTSDAFSGTRAIILDYSGGGGGGGTFVYELDRRGRKPLIVGAGGGGAGPGLLPGEIAQNGRGIDPTRSGMTGSEYGIFPPGAGGGWNTTRNRTRDVTGRTLFQGGLGGHSCGFPKGYHGMGGFGGGGGGCTSGGGGGGFSGGSASMHWKTGRGGYSYLDLRMQERQVFEGNNPGPGSVIIIPAVKGCGCSYLCAAVDENLEYVKCICSNGKILDEDMESCPSIEETNSQSPTEISEGILLIREELLYALMGMVALSIICLTGHIVYKCCRRIRKLREIRANVINPPEPAPTADIQLQSLPPSTETQPESEPQTEDAQAESQPPSTEIQLHSLPPSTDIQLLRLRHPGESMITQLNPTYEVAGPSIDLSRVDLPEIPRERLRFCGALGQGAFGEVYKGYYRETADGPEKAVAVKTLPTFTSPDSESDFFMEAVIMSKFSHPNIVQFIGVCFDRHPRFIILELLAGGDLKNFLRENRPHAGDPNRLTMKDLLKFARDIAQGCAYLEERRFIHRDIAARNCLLTSKGPDKMVKIADFGMAKDIYRSDYYRKAGRAMLPVKWMPPEAFQDGVFTSKTDVWSYGVLLWEVMSVGFMPYTGYGNHEVMQLVVRGARLQAPKNCPTEIYAIMKLCWQRIPEDRPTFTYILERIGYCLQDPVITSTKLPLFMKTTKEKRRKRDRRKVVTFEGGETAARPETEDDFEDDDDDGMIVEDDEGEEGENAEAIAAAIAATQITYAETDFSDPQPGTSQGALGDIKSELWECSRNYT